MCSFVGCESARVGSGGGRFGALGFGVLGFGHWASVHVPPRSSPGSCAQRRPAAGSKQSACLRFVRSRGVAGGRVDARSSGSFDPDVRRPRAEIGALMPRHRCARHRLPRRGPSRDTRASRARSRPEPSGGQDTEARCSVPCRPCTLAVLSARAWRSRTRVRAAPPRPSRDRTCSRTAAPAGRRRSIASPPGTHPPGSSRSARSPRSRAA